MIADTHLTFEELSTLLAQIEACLNSRPLCPINNDPSNLLTPGHFLIGEALISQPTEIDLNPDLKTTTNWHLFDRKRHEFWKNWSTEYLTRLQQHPKWMRNMNNFKIGDLVLIKEDNSPPTRWARAYYRHPPRDGQLSEDCDPTGQGSENDEKAHSKAMSLTSLAH